MLEVPLYLGIIIGILSFLVITVYEDGFNEGRENKAKVFSENNLLCPDYCSQSPWAHRDECNIVKNIIGRFNTGQGSSFSFVARGNYLFLAESNSAELITVDLKNPGRPAEAARTIIRIGDNSPVFNLKLINESFYNHQTNLRNFVLAAGDNGKTDKMIVIDVSNPLSLVAVFAADLSGPAVHFYFSRDMLFIGEGNDRLERYSLQNLPELKLAGSLHLPYGDGRERAVYPFGHIEDVLYVKANSRIYQIDVSDPAVLKSVGTSADPPEAIYPWRNISYYGDKIFAGGAFNKPVVLDFSGGNEPEIIQQFDIGKALKPDYFGGFYVYFLNPVNAERTDLIVYDVSSLKSFKEYNLKFKKKVHDIQINGGFLYARVSAEKNGKNYYWLEIYNAAYCPYHLELKNTIGKIMDEKLTADIFAGEENEPPLPPDLTDRQPTGRCEHCLEIFGCSECGTPYCVEMYEPFSGFRCAETAEDLLLQAGEELCRCETEENLKEAADKQPADEAEKDQPSATAEVGADTPDKNFETCGNGKIDEGETCDLGSECTGDPQSCNWAPGTLGADCACSKLNPDCKSSYSFNWPVSCIWPRCGDGEVNNYITLSGGLTVNYDLIHEECDDSNVISTDVCVACQASRCGDGYVCESADCVSGPNGSKEECDDGNNEDGDGCSSLCQKETCDPQRECCSHLDCTRGYFCTGSGQCECNPKLRCCSNEDCSDGLACNMESGTCTCNPQKQCCKHEHCPGTELCENGWCNCSSGRHCCSDGDCPAGLQCNPILAVCQCRPDRECCSDGDCPDKQKCHITSGTCRACDPMFECCENSDCVTNLCKEGSCQKCQLDSDCTENPNRWCDNGVCVECKTTQECSFGICADNRCRGCRSDNDCSSGSCDKITGSCVPCLSDEECSGGVCRDGACLQCQLDADCPGGYECAGNLCVECVGYSCGGCIADSDCPAGICKNGNCIGCTKDSECRNGNVCQGGWCLLGCRDDYSCRSGEICRDEICVAGCRNRGNCDRGYICQDEMCAPCQKHSDCLPDEECDNGSCKPAKPAAPAEAIPVIPKQPADTEIPPAAAVVNLQPAAELAAAPFTAGTGPAAAALLIGGAAVGIGWLRRKKDR